MKYIKIEDEPDVYENFPDLNFLTARLKVTPTRTVLINILTVERKPMSVTKIREKMKESKLPLSSSTIYRNLEVLINAGLVNRVFAGSNYLLYEIAPTRKNHHHHIICTKCGNIEDTKTCFTDSMIHDVLAHSEKFSDTASHSVEFFGICNMCKKAINTL